MEILIYISLGIVIGYFAYRVLSVEKIKIETVGNGVHREQLILKFIETKGEIKNNDIQKMFKVSDATATRYLQKLEDAGKIKQVGEAGRFVYYEKA